MKVTEMDSIEPGNPFISDSYNMGFSLGTNVTVMYGNFANQFMKYLIIINIKINTKCLYKIINEKTYNKKKNINFIRY